MGKTFAQRIIADGRITIPSHVREELGVERGDYVKVKVEGLDDE